MVRTAMQDLMTELRGETSRDNQPTNKNDGNKVTNETRRSSQAERKRSLRHVFNHISGLRVKTFNSGGKNVNFWGKSFNFLGESFYFGVKIECLK